MRKFVCKFSTLPPYKPIPVGDLESWKYVLQHWESKSVYERKEETRELFYPLVAAAICKKLTSWENSPKSSLALTLLLDHYPRIIFAGTPDEDSGLREAVRVTRFAISQNYDKKLDTNERIQLYKPLLRDENWKEEGNALLSKIYEFQE
eukprot:g1025.t1